MVDRICMCKEASACNERADWIFLEKWSIHKWLLEQHEWMLLLLAIGATISEVSPFHFTSRSLATGRVCGVLVLLFSFCFGVVFLGVFLV